MPGKRSARKTNPTTGRKINPTTGRDINPLSGHDIQTWSEMFPDGRFIYYEGDDPAGFVSACKDLYKFDPSTDPAWGEKFEDGFTSYAFHCPAHLLDPIYGGTDGSHWPMGS